MRTIHTLPHAAAILRAACGGAETDADGDGDGAISGEEVAAEASGLVQPRPGQYRASLELLEFDAPGMPPEAKQQMQQIFASGLSEGNSFCMTEEDVAQGGPEQIVKNLAESDCEMKTFQVSGGSVVAEMQCERQGAKANTVRIEGEMTPESSVMTMDMTQDMAGVGEMNMKMRVNSQRIGDCTA